MKIDYNHSNNVHTLKGAVATLSTLFSSAVPKSMLDVGCGTGTWLQAAIDLGVPHVVGVDGIIVEDQLFMAKDKIEQLDLTMPFDLGERFDIALCLEVAEHLPDTSARTLISSLTNHSDLVLFSAACPGQPGQHHVNCQWPSYWQALFNDCGFVCEDSVRWKIWEDTRIEPWYRQNLFFACRDLQRAGQEPRIRAAVHPEFFESRTSVRDDVMKGIEDGSEKWTWYLTMLVRAAMAKINRRRRYKSV
jgi:SAM-dependent methyltransferase